MAPAEDLDFSLPVLPPVLPAPGPLPRCVSGRGARPSAASPARVAGCRPKHSPALDAVPVRRGRQRRRGRVKVSCRVLPPISPIILSGGLHPGRPVYLPCPPDFSPPLPGLVPRFLVMRPKDRPRPAPRYRHPVLHDTFYKKWLYLRQYWSHAAFMVSALCGHCVRLGRACVPGHFDGAFPIPYCWRDPTVDGISSSEHPSHFSLALSAIECDLILDVYERVLFYNTGSLCVPAPAPVPSDPESDWE